jgi:hypothetical protein
MAMGHTRHKTIRRLWEIPVTKQHNDCIWNGEARSGQTHRAATFKEMWHEDDYRTLQVRTPSPERESIPQTFSNEVTAVPTLHEGNSLWRSQSLNCLPSGSWTLAVRDWLREDHSIPGRGRHSFFRRQVHTEFVYLNFYYFRQEIERQRASIPRTQSIQCRQCKIDIYEKLNSASVSVEIMYRNEWSLRVITYSIQAIVVACAVRGFWALRDIYECLCGYNRSQGVVIIYCLGILDFMGYYNPEVLKLWGAGPLRGRELIVWGAHLF